MNEYEQNLVLIEYMNLLNQFTEFWLTISFAVVVAATYAPDTLNKKYHSLMWGGYLAASVVLLLSRASSSSALWSLSAEMAESGSGPRVDPILGTLSSGGIWLLMIFGTIFIVYYVKNVAKSSDVERT